MRVQPALLTLFVLASFGFSAAAAPSPGEALLKKARAERAALEARPARQKIRQHVEAVAQAFARAEKVVEGPAKIEALEGELYAAKLLARWSGLARDKQRAVRVERQLAEARTQLAARTKKREPRSESTAEVSGGSRRWLSDVRLEGKDRELRLVLEANGAVEAKKSIIESKKGVRVVLDLSPLAASLAALGPVPVKGGAIKAARVLQLDKETVRLLVDVADARAASVVELVEGHTVALAPRAKAAARSLAAKAPAKIEAEAPRTRDAKKEAEAPTESVVKEVLAQMIEEVRQAIPDVEVEPEVASEAEAASASEAPAPTEAEEPARPTPPAIKRSKRASAGSSAELVRIRRVVIDAGHGGKDVGAIGVGGIQEKDVNLAVALRLGAELRERLGLEVTFTRERDVFLSLQERSAIANGAGADLFLSVHANAHRKKTVHGMETYYLNVTSDRYATRLAHRENTLEHEATDGPEPGAGMSESDPESLLAGALGRDLRLVLADLAMRSATVESKRLARNVQASAASALRRAHPDFEDLGVKHALFYVLLGTRMPSILIETGFITHPVEGRRLGSADYQKRLARSIADGVARFVEEREALARRIDEQESSLGNLSHVRAAP